MKILVGKSCGYYIVRNERTEATKTILDTGILTPTLVDSKKRFVSSGFLYPNLSSDTTLKTNVTGLINPEFKFNKREYKNFTMKVFTTV